MSADQSSAQPREDPKVIVSSRIVDGITYTVVDGADNAFTAAKAKILRHPNIIAFSSVTDLSSPTARKGSVVGLPFCTSLAECLPILSPSEILYGLLGLAEALEMCTRGKVYFKSLAATQIGVAIASLKCHPVNAHRWVLLDFSSAKGADAAASSRAFVSFAGSLFQAVDPLVLSATCLQQWDGRLTFAEGNPIEKLLQEGEGDAATFFASAISLFRSTHDPLLEAFAIGQDLPTYYAIDSLDTSSSVRHELTSAYERLQDVVHALATPLCIKEGEASKTVSFNELDRCVFTWLLTPEHLAQPASAHLFTDIFTSFVPRGASAKGPLANLILECLQASDPQLAIRFYAHAAQLSQCMTLEQLFWVAEGAVFSSFYTGSGVAAEWVSLDQLRYARAIIKASEHVLNAMVAKDNESLATGAVLGSMAEELPSLMVTCIEAAENGSEYMAEHYRLMRDAILAIGALIPLAAAARCPSSVIDRCKASILMPLFHWSLLTREQAINVAVSAIGTSIPLHHCGFLLNAMLALCGSEEGSMRNAACTGLLRLKDAIGGTGNDDAVAVRIANGEDLPRAYAARPEPTTIQAFVSIEHKRLAAAGYVEGGGLIASLGKERIKLGAAPPSSVANSIFRTAYDKRTFTAVLPHLAF